MLKKNFVLLFSFLLLLSCKTRQDEKDLDNIQNPNIDVSPFDLDLDNESDSVQNQNEPNPIQNKNDNSDLIETTDLNPEKEYTALGINQPYEAMNEALNELINTPNSLEKYNLASEILKPSRKIEFNLKDISASRSTSVSSTFALILNSNVIGLTIINLSLIHISEPTRPY